MALITTGKSFIQELEKVGSLGLLIPLEGGHEGRYQRRLRAAGYRTMHLSARGLGDPSTYLLDVHGVRPPHLGKKNMWKGTGRDDAAVGYTYYLPPAATYLLENLPAKAKGVAIWLMEGNILSRQELEFLTELPKQEPRLKVVVEMGGGRSFTWKPLTNFLAAA